MQETEKSTSTDAAHDTRWRAAKRAVDRLRRGRADERGLTTLEWLLIVAAVAGLAALAVVLVQNVVDDTAEQIGGNSARGTAARIAAETITREARTALPDAVAIIADTGSVTDAADHRAAQLAVNLDAASACTRLKINYGDIGETFKAEWIPALPAPGGGAAAVDLAMPGSTNLADSATTAWTDPLVLVEAFCKVTVPES